MLFGAALERRDLVNVFLKGALVGLGVPWSGGVDVFSRCHCGEWTFGWRRSGPRRRGIRSLCTVRHRFIGSILDRLIGPRVDGHDPVYLLHGGRGRGLGDTRLDIRGPFLGARGRRGQKRFTPAKLIYERRFRNCLGFVGARLHLWPTRAAVAPASSFAVRLIVLLALRLGFLLKKRLSVGDRNLVIVRMNFGEGQKAVAIAAIVDESGLERRLYAGDLGKIDIPAQRSLACRTRSQTPRLDCLSTPPPGFLPDARRR